jgi:two-component system sensor histidine kinase/response regulator
LYGQILATFVQAHQAEPDLLREQVQAGDAAALRSLAHRIKGAAATIGAHGLAGQAGPIEQALRAQAGHADAAADDGLWDQALALASAMAALLQALAQQLPGLSAHAGAGQVPTQPHPDDARALQALKHALSEADLSAGELSRRHADALSRQLGPQAHLFQRAVAHFDYESALRLLQQAGGPSAPPS